MGKVIQLPGAASAQPARTEPTFLDLDALIETLDIVHGIKGAPVEAFEDVIEFVDQLRGGAPNQGASSL